jgi:hypothetical protein
MAVANGTMKGVGIVLGWFALACGSLPLAIAGEIRGQILVTKVLTRRRVDLPDYQLRGVLPPPPPPGPPVGGELSRTVVYVDGPPTRPASPITPRLIQKGTRFIPEILVVPVGSVVSFPNEDPIFHNVFSLSKAKQFDLGYYPSGETRRVEFDKVGIVQVYCHIHRDMNSAILVVPNEWYVQPDKDGNFSLKGIPAGTQQVVVWHKSAGLFRKRVEVPAQGIKEVTFTIPIPTPE